MLIETLILFTTDLGMSYMFPFSQLTQNTDFSPLVGLERILRLVHSLLQIIVSVPLLVGYAAALLDTGSFRGSVKSPAVHDATALMLATARDRVNLGRRFSRMFRFIESFHGAHQLYVKLFSEEDPAAKSETKSKRTRLDTWLDAFACTFAGLYLVLETSTIVDALDVPGVGWGPEIANKLNVEGQRYWFLSLSCSVAATIVRILNITRDYPMPQPTEEEKEDNMGSRLGDGGEAEKDGEDKAESLNEERLRLRRIVQGRMPERRKWMKTVQGQLVVLGRKVVADAVDVLLPGCIVGWTPLQPATVGYVMLFTTLLTSYDVWLRCGREVAATKAAEEAAEAMKAAEAAKAAEKKKE